MHENVWIRRQYDSLISSKQKLFEFREYDKQLSENKGDLFQLVVGKKLFTMKRSRPYLETAVSFLTNIFPKSDINDWGKLRRILRFFTVPSKKKGLLVRQT